jgi:hypothetical protein
MHQIEIKNGQDAHILGAPNFIWIDFSVRTPPKRARIETVAVLMTAKGIPVNQ